MTVYQNSGTPHRPALPHYGYISKQQRPALPV